MNKDIILRNGDKICLSPNGNTYIGDKANLFGSWIRKYNITNEQFIDLCVSNEAMKPLISNIVTIN